MKFNPTKCNIISLSRGQSKQLNFIPCMGLSWNMSKRPSIKYLGVILSDDLQWARNINSIVAKSGSTLGLLGRNFFHCPPVPPTPTPRLEYCSSVCDPHYTKDVNTIERIQRRAARFVTNQHHPTPTPPLHDVQNSEGRGGDQSSRLPHQGRQTHQE